MDLLDRCYRWLLGLVLFAQVRVIGEARQRVRERRERRYPETAIGFMEILKADRLFRLYQMKMFATGFGAMLIEAPLIFIITRQMQASYTQSIMLTMVIPFAVGLLSMPLWANYLDRVHVAQFRSRQSVLWILAQLLTMLGAMLGSFVWLVIARTIMGVARGRRLSSLAAWPQRLCSPRSAGSLHGAPCHSHRC